MGYDIAIVGSGISGMSLAHYCAKEGLKTLVLEESARIGGAFHSHRLPAESGDFWFEMGAHTCYNSYGHFLKIIEDCRLADQLVQRQQAPYRMVVDDQLKSIPSQLNFGQLLWSAPRMLFMQKSGASIESYYSRALGQRNFRRVFSPLFSAVPSQNADEFPADALFKKRARHKDYPRSFTLHNGLQSIIEAIASHPLIELQTERAITSIRPEANSVRIDATDGSCWQSRTVALATPVSIAAQLLRPAFAAVAQSLSAIEQTCVESIGVALPADLLSRETIAGAIPIADSFYSAVSRDVVPHPDYRAFTFHFGPGLLDREAKLQRIGAVLGQSMEKAIAIVERKSPMPSLRVGHQQRVDAVDASLTGTGLYLTGNYFAGLSIEDCVARSYSQFLQLQQTGLGRT